MAVTSATEVFGGPAYVAIGDPAQAAGAGMVDLGLVPRVSVQLQFHRQINQNEIGQRLPDGTRGALKGATATLRMMNKSATILAALFPEFTDNTSSMSVSETFSLLTLPTLVIMPVDGYGSGPTYRQLQTLPAVTAVNIGEFIRKIEETTESTEPFDVTFEASLRTTDQQDEPILAGYRIWFEGDLADATSTPTQPWTLPTGY